MRISKLHRIILAIFVITFCFYLSIISIPKFQGREIQIDQSYYLKHTKNTVYYRLKVIKGNYYWFSIITHPYWGVDPKIYLYPNVLRINGVLLDTTRENGESINFFAEKNGYYYVTVKSSKGAFFQVSLSLDPYHVFVPTYNTYVNSWKFAILITPLVVIGGCTSFALINKYNAKKKMIELKQKSDSVCPICEAIKPKETKYCKYCGFTFEGPKIADSNLGD